MEEPWIFDKKKSACAEEIFSRKEVIEVRKNNSRDNLYLNLY
jgi:hypothetical protein